MGHLENKYGHSEEINYIIIIHIFFCVMRNKFKLGEIVTLKINENAIIEGCEVFGVKQFVHCSKYDIAVPIKYLGRTETVFLDVEEFLLTKEENRGKRTS